MEGVVAGAWALTIHIKHVAPTSELSKLASTVSHSTELPKPNVRQLMIWMVVRRCT